MSDSRIVSEARHKVEDPAALLQENLAVACNDAGGTNLIIGWLKRVPGIRVKAHLGGPAIALWDKAFPGARIFTLAEALSGSTQLLSGTGWATSLEHDARVAARARGIPSVAALDHWVNYAERFERAGTIVRPQELWVTDEYAFNLARDLGNESRVRLVPNAYLEEQVSQIRQLDAKRGAREAGHVLYALEPIRKPWKIDQAESGEFQALDFFCANLGLLGLSAKTSIRLRPHPSDPPGKYDAWCGRQAGRDVRMAPDEPLSEAIARADWVVGCESFVLVVGLAAGRKVATTLPPWAPRGLLPHTNLVHLRDLAERNR